MVLTAAEKTHYFPNVYDVAYWRALTMNSDGFFSFAVFFN